MNLGLVKNPNNKNNIHVHISHFMQKVDTENSEGLKTV